jgi:hypothetical protein
MSDYLEGRFFYPGVATKGVEPKQAFSRIVESMRKCPIPEPFSFGPEEEGTLNFSEDDVLVPKEKDAKFIPVLLHCSEIDAFIDDGFEDHAPRDLRKRLVSWMRAIRDATRPDLCYVAHYQSSVEAGMVITWLTYKAGAVKRILSEVSLTEDPSRIDNDSDNWEATKLAQASRPLPADLKGQAKRIVEFVAGDEGFLKSCSSAGEYVEVIISEEPP